MNPTPRWTPPAGHNLQNLDVLRAFAVLVVAGSHLCRYCSNTRFAAFIDNLGVGGVLLFFVHTSLVLLLSIERMKARNLTLSFYIRRAFRIYPLCWVAMALVLTTGWTDVDHQKILQMGWRGVVVNALLLQNIIRYPNLEMPLWSLPWEVQMYLFLPAFYLLLKKYGHKSTPLTLWIGAAGLAIACTTLNLPRAFHAAIFPPLFMGGMVAFRLLREAPLKLPSFLWPAGVIALMVTRCALLDGVLFDRPRNVIVNVVTCLVLGLGIPVFQEVRSRWVSCAAHQIAKYSYGIYLLHIPCLALVFRHLPALPLPLTVGAFLALTGVASAFTYHWVEHPLIQLGRSVAARIESSPDSKVWQPRLPSDEPPIFIDAPRISS